ncbi:helix-turn-helix transcriptional regulator [Bradyrhizobium sp.]|uniref:helix-turn-helix transcriptional regulator n=1 Tax=Bradyrhizobium sp. TaxID=376 RepID=UPI003BAF0438
MAPKPQQNTFHQQLNNKNPPTKNRATRRQQRVERRGDRDDGDNNDADSSPSPVKGGAGYKNGPHKKVPLPIGAKWATPLQVCDRYGGKSDMWLWRKIKDDPNFPKPFYMGRRRLFLVADLDAYDLSLIQKVVA